MEDGFEEKHPFSQIKVHHNGSHPHFWLLGSSPWSATAAAEMGLSYFFAGFINPGQAYQITQHYVRTFRTVSGAVRAASPKLTLSLSVYCAETETVAARLTAPVQLMMKRQMAGDIRSRLEETAIRLVFLNLNL